MRHDDFDPIARRRAKRAAQQRMNLIAAACVAGGLGLCTGLFLVVATLARHNGRAGAGVSVFGHKGEKWDMADLRIYLRDHGLQVEWCNPNWTLCNGLPGGSAYIVGPLRPDHKQWEQSPYVWVEIMDTAATARKKENISGGWAWGKFYFNPCPKSGHIDGDNRRSIELMEQIKRTLD